MICLTGDIHHTSLKINDQLYIPNPEDTEVKIARRYLALLEKYGVKATFYITGKTLKEEWTEVKEICRSPLVEAAGHTYAGLPRSRVERLINTITGRTTLSHGMSHGPRKKQRKDIDKTMKIFKDRLDKEIVSWRSHGLVRDEHTYDLLKSAGIQNISDEINWTALRPKRLENGLLSHPLNVITDHDHIYHAHRTKEYVRKQQENWPLKEDPTSKSYSIEEWGKIVEEQTAKIIEGGGLATILMHPLCMYLADEFKTAEKLIQFFSKHRTMWACEIHDYEKTDR